MKITIRKTAGDVWEGYIAKKDLEAKIVHMENPNCWGGIITLDNGWRFQMPDMDPDTRLPLTVEARKLADVE
jgi:probable nitrogen fixation protein FixT